MSDLAANHDSSTVSGDITMSDFAAKHDSVPVPCSEDTRGVTCSEDLIRAQELSTRVETDLVMQEKSSPNISCDGYSAISSPDGHIDNGHVTEPLCDRLTSNVRVSDDESESESESDYASAEEDHNEKQGEDPGLAFMKEEEDHSENQGEDPGLAFMKEEEEVKEKEGEIIHDEEEDEEIEEILTEEVKLVRVR